MKTINLFKQLLPSLQRGLGGRLFLFLFLLVAGAQSAWAQVENWVNKHADVETVTVGGVTYEVCHEYWRKGYINYRGLGGYQEFGISDEDYYTIWPIGSFRKVNEYYASVIGITGSGIITIPESINNGGVDYPVRYVGLHTEQKLSTHDETYTVSEGNIHLEINTTKKYYDCIKTNVSVTASNVTKLIVNADVEFKGNFAATRCTSVVFNKDVTFSANLICPTATEMVFNDYVTINESATLSCNNVSTLTFNGLSHKGKIQCNSLTDIYYQRNLPEYSRSFSNYFTNVSGSQITAHVANKTQAECTTIHSSWAVYNEFAAVVPYTVTNPKYTVQVKIENARVQITYTNNGNTYTSTCNTTRNITVDGSSDLIIRPYKTYNELGLASVTLNGAEIIRNLTGSGTMYDAYTISDITSDVYLAFTGEELVDVTVKVEASAPQSHFITNSFWVRPNYGQSDNLYANQSATFTLSKYNNFFFEMEFQEDETWGISWQPAAIYVNGKDRTEDITYDMTTWFELECITGDTEIRVVFEPNCDFVRVMSLSEDLVWTRFDERQMLIDCSEGDNYYVPVSKNGNGVVVRTDLIPSLSAADFEVIYWKNNGRYDVGQASMDQGGVELTPDGKNFQFKLLPNVKDQDRIIGIYPKATVPSSGTLQTVIRNGGGMSHMEFSYEKNCDDQTDNIIDGDCKQYLLPPYGEECETSFNFLIRLLDGETFKVYRNGKDYTDYFRKGNYNSNNKYTAYSFYDSYWINDDPEFWSSLREAATWEVFIEPATIDYTFIGDFNKVSVYADYNGDNDSYEGNELEAENIEGLFSGKIIEKPENIGIEAAIYIRMPNPDDTFRAFRNGVEMEFNKDDSGSNILWYLISDEDWMHEPAQWVIITDSELSRYDVNRDKQISIADVTKLVNKILGQSPN